MQQELAPSMDGQIDITAYLNALRRRYLYLLITPALVFAGVCVVTYRLLPVVYQASATILIVSQQIPSDLASSIVKAGAMERIQAIQQRLMTRDNILETARKFDIYPKELSPSAIIDSIRAATEIVQLDVGERVARPDTQSIGFTVSFKHADPDIASKVANQFAASILEQNTRSRESRAAETRKFFEQQVRKLEQGLADVETRIADFKSANAGALPETLTDRRIQLGQLQSAIAEIDRSIALGSDQQQIGTATLKIELLNNRLESNKQQLRAVTDQRRDLEPLLQKGFITKSRILELDRTVASLQGEIQSITTDIAVETSKLRYTDVEGSPKQRAELAERAAALKETILKTPEVEAAYNALTREHDNMQAEYSAVKAKMAAAATGEQLEEDRWAERFEVIDQATVPNKPLSPDRPRIIKGGALASVAAGVGMVVFMELLDKSIRSSADLEKLLQIRPLVTIPYVTTIAERNRKRWVLWALLLLAVFLVGTLFLVHEFYRPLDVLAQNLLELLTTMA